MIGGITDRAWARLIACCEATWPREACGWLAGVDAIDEVRPAAAGTADRFALSDDDLLALARAHRAGPPPRLLFHSHPGGDPDLSATDLAALAPGGVVLHPLPHLVIALRDGRAQAATLHGWRDGRAHALATVRRDRDGWRADGEARP